MGNLSSLSRKEQVLAVLSEARGAWVDGPNLANEQVGGSEGLKRLRELRDDDGYPIEARRHPEPGRDIWQYRLDPAGLQVRKPPNRSTPGQSPVSGQPARGGEVVGPLPVGLVVGESGPEAPASRVTYTEPKAQFGDLNMIRAMRPKSRRR